MIEDQALYLLERISWWEDNVGEGNWTTVGTFKIQSYHKITVTAEDLNGGQVTAAGEALKDS